MPNVEKRTVSLPQNQASYADRLVTSGAYASVSEVVRAGLRALQERDKAIEEWLRGDVARTYDVMKKDPDLAIDIDTVFKDLRTHHMARVNKNS